jgi:hypothetical protein
MPQMIADAKPSKPLFNQPDALRPFICAICVICGSIPICSIPILSTADGSDERGLKLPAALTDN